MVYKPPVVWHPAHWSNYTAAYRGWPQIDRVVIHVTQGSWSSAINWFQTPSSGASAHYVIRSWDGAIAQCVSDRNIAWHAGNWTANQMSIGIEHEGYMSNPEWFTYVMYRSSAKLVAHLCQRYFIPIDSWHIVGHNHLANTPCPGQWWWWDHYMRHVRWWASR